MKKLFFAVFLLITYYSPVFAQFDPQTRPDPCSYKIPEEDSAFCPEQYIDFCDCVGSSGKLEIEKLELPYAGTLADYLEGPFYNPAKLQELINLGFKIPELHGPIDKLTPRELQDCLRCLFIFRIKRDELSDFFVYRNGEKISVTVIPCPPVPPANFFDGQECPYKTLGQEVSEEERKHYENAYQEWLKNWGDLWPKVPMFARNDAQGLIHLSSPNASILPKENQFELSVPHLARLNEVSGMLWKILVPKYKGPIEEQDDCPGGRTDPPYDEICARGSAQINFKTKDRLIKADITLPFLKTIRNSLAAPQGLFTAIARPDIDSEDYPDIWKPEKLEAALSKLVFKWNDIKYSTLVKIPFLGGIQTAKEWVIAALTPGEGEVAPGPEEPPGPAPTSCPEGGNVSGFCCDYAGNPYHIPDPDPMGRCNPENCHMKYFSGSVPYGDCYYCNPNVCVRKDGAGGCAGTCNLSCCQ